MAQLATLKIVVRHFTSKNPDLLNRIERAHAIARTAGAIEFRADCERGGPSPRWYVLASNQEDWYQVDLHDRTCTCPDEAPRGWCKHLLALAIVGSADAWELKHGVTTKSTPAARHWALATGQQLPVAVPGPVHAVA